MESCRPLISVIITTRNEEVVIEKLLQSVRAQTYPHLEVILVDNHSTDRTCEIARLYVDKLLVQGPERSAQRNLGVREAAGDYVLTLDADMELSPTVVEEAVILVIENPDIKAVCIPERSFGDNFWAQCKALERDCYLDDHEVTATRFFERGVFLRVGGYDETLHAAEDWDLSQRMGQVARIGYLKSIIYSIC